MSTIRGKFRVVCETKNCWSDEARTVKLQAMYDPDVPEDQAYAKATPTGTIEMLVDNPNAKFELGEYYYADFTKVEQGS